MKFPVIYIKKYLFVLFLIISYKTSAQHKIELFLLPQTNYSTINNLSTPAIQTDVASVRFTSEAGIALTSKNHINYLGYLLFQINQSVYIDHQWNNRKNFREVFNRINYKQLFRILSDDLKKVSCFARTRDLLWVQKKTDYPGKFLFSR